ncbi:peroxiredoxin TSA1 [Trichinella spiralis]|uniref:peroxiredoxin TSA1 n=1 Tax=Trichinella spiralis TaxID=6334 RepID=UPI0001EFEC40|nr:peroxiredoxin TSA1 [Trichinella spiralis]
MTVTLTDRIYPISQMTRELLTISSVCLTVSSRQQNHKLSKFKSKNCPSVGEPAPNFSTLAVVDERIVNIKLTDYRGSYLVLFFYPRDFDSSCSSEIINFHENVENFQKIGCKIAACSTDSEYCHLAWLRILHHFVLQFIAVINCEIAGKRRILFRIRSLRCENGLGKLDFPLFADPVHIISKLYGVYQEEQGFNLRLQIAVFIIDNNGILRQMCINDIHWMKLSAQCRLCNL